MSVNHTPSSLHSLILSMNVIIFEKTTLTNFGIFTFQSLPSETAGREERDLEGDYCTVKPGWKRRIPSDLRS